MALLTARLKFCAKSSISLILLVVAFRSVLVPIKATLGYLLSVAVMFGALVAVFQWGWLDIANAPGPIVSFLPLIALGILFGLAMDYEFFLVSSIKNEHRTEANAAKSIVRGIDMSGKVVTAAALIMVAVFSGFIANDNSVVQALGFALAVGVLVDAFIVRLLIVPAVMKLLGNTAWWAPKWLKAIIPDDLLGH
jgi:RND superfamily putative drug exporter